MTESIEYYQERMRRIERERKRRARLRVLVFGGVIACIVIFWAVVVLWFGHVAGWWS